MIRYRNFIIAIAGVLIIGGCTGKTTSSNINEPASDARTTAFDGSLYLDDAHAIVPGTITNVASEAEQGDNTSHVVVSVSPPTGGTVSVVFDAGQHIVSGIYGESATADASVEPGPYFIPLSLAMDLARREVNGKVMRWSFERSAIDNVWTYRVEIRDSLGLRHEIILNAISKSILSASTL